MIQNDVEFINSSRPDLFLWQILTEHCRPPEGWGQSLGRPVLLECRFTLKVTEERVVNR